jgi:peptide/nickel transport system substrate-binding protein
MLEAPRTREGLALVRNPYFDVWSPEAQPAGNVDRIEWAFGVEPGAQVRAVAAGDADVALDASEAELESIAVRFAAQVYTSPQAATYFVVLNTAVPPFDDVVVRRALNLAVDRERFVEILGGAARPTCQQLPPNFPAYGPYCPYTIDPGPEGEGVWNAPDLQEARRLVRRSGTVGMRVRYEFTPIFGGWTAAFADRMVDLLHEMGYRASVRSLPIGDLFSPGNEFQMALGGWILDYPAASNFFTTQFTCEASLFESARFCDPAIDAMIERAIRIQADDPVAAGALWAAVDRAVVDHAWYIWLANPIVVDFVSERVGNYQWNPQWEVLFSQLWVR